MWRREGRGVDEGVEEGAVTQRVKGSLLLMRQLVRGSSRVACWTRRGCGVCRGNSGGGTVICSSRSGSGRYCASREGVVWKEGTGVVKNHRWFDGKDALGVCAYIYIYIFVCICVCTYIHVYMCVCDPYVYVIVYMAQHHCCAHSIGVFL